MNASCECGGVGHYHYGVCQVCGGTLEIGLDGEPGGAPALCAAAGNAAGVGSSGAKSGAPSNPVSDRHRVGVSGADDALEA